MAWSTEKLRASAAAGLLERLQVLRDDRLRRYQDKQMLYEPPERAERRQYNREPRCDRRYGFPSHVLSFLYGRSSKAKTGFQSFFILAATQACLVASYRG
jgi:hypothetical protein